MTRTDLFRLPSPLLDIIHTQLATRPLPIPVPTSFSGPWKRSLCTFCRPRIACAQSSFSRIPRRNMSRVEDHQITEAGKKKPAVPKPSSRYAQTKHRWHSLLIVGQCRAHLTYKPNPPSAPRKNFVVLSLSARLSWWQCLCLPRRPGSWP